MIIHERLDHVGDNYIPVSTNARILHVGMRGDHKTVWIDEPFMDEREHKNILWVSMTGQDSPLNYPYHVGTIMDDPFVWHVFTNTWSLIDKVRAGYPYPRP